MLYFGAISFGPLPARAARMKSNRMAKKRMRNRERKRAKLYYLAWKIHCNLCGRNNARLHALAQFKLGQQNKAIMPCEERETHDMRTPLFFPYNISSMCFLFVIDIIFCFIMLTKPLCDLLYKL